MPKIDWRLVRNDYEIMHTGVQELATSHHTSESMIRAAITDGGWKRLDVESVDVDSLSDRLQVMESKHQGTLVPKFILLQAKMLDKCDDLLDEVNKIEDAPYLKIVSEVIEKHRPSIMGVKKDAGQDNNMNIRIMTQVGGGDQPAISAVEITQSAGSSNGIGAIENHSAEKIIES